MKANKMTFVAMMMVAMVMMGCQPAIDSLPEPEPEPVQMPAGTIGADYEKVASDGTILSGTAMYRWDTDADGDYDTGLFVEIGGVELAVSLTNPEWIITVGGNAYLNATRMTPESWTNGFSETLTFVRVAGQIVADIDNTATYEYSEWDDWTYNTVDGSINGTVTWTKD